MSDSTTQGQLYLTAIESGERLAIQYVPRDLRVSRRADFGTIDIVGRNNPRRHYTGGEETLSLDLDFHSVDENREDVISKCRWLKSISMNNGYSDPPERVRLTFGRMFQNELWLIRSVDITYDRFEAGSGFLPVQAYVRLDLVLSTPNNLERTQVRWR